MQRFAQLYAAIDETNKTNEKVAAMARYFASAPPEDAAWAMSFLIGRRPKRLINSTKLSTWAYEEAGIPEWLFWECYDAVGDLAEAIAAVLPDRPEPEAVVNENVPLHLWVRDRLLPLASLPEEDQKEMLVRAWRDLDRQGRFVYNKLITGAFRVGVSQDLVIRGLSQASGVPSPAPNDGGLVADGRVLPGFGGRGDVGHGRQPALSVLLGASVGGRSGDARADRGVARGVEVGRDPLPVGQAERAVLRVVPGRGPDYRAVPRGGGDLRRHAGWDGDRWRDPRLGEGEAASIP
jgi:hypothetical protein